jgi:hypothetical protein
MGFGQLPKRHRVHPVGVWPVRALAEGCALAGQGKALREEGSAGNPDTAMSDSARGMDTSPCGFRRSSGRTIEI